MNASNSVVGTIFLLYNTVPEVPYIDFLFFFSAIQTPA